MQDARFHDDRERSGPTNPPKSSRFSRLYRSERRPQSNELASCMTDTITIIFVRFNQEHPLFPRPDLIEFGCFTEIELRIVAPIIESHIYQTKVFGNVLQRFGGD